MAQREIKFRAWDGKQMLTMDTERYSYPVFVCKDGYTWLNWDDYIKMQFTGLKDKNGREIYEGDILEKREMDYGSDEWREWEEGDYEGPEPEKTLIKRDVCTLENFRYWLKNESFGYEGEDMESPDEWTVVGNRYENPELLQP